MAYIQGGARESFRLFYVRDSGYAHRPEDIGEELPMSCLVSVRKNSYLCKRLVVLKFRRVV